MTGWSTIGGNNNFTQAFLDTNGVMQDLRTLGGTGSHAYSVNNSGQVVGDIAMGGQNSAFIFSDGALKNMNTLLDSSGKAHGWSLNLATSINDAEQITGYGTIDGGMHAFLLTPSTLDAQAPTSVPLPSTTWTGLVRLGGWGFLQVGRSRSVFNE